MSASPAFARTASTVSRLFLPSSARQPPNSKKGKDKASEQESALSLATGTANVCIFFAVLTFIGTLITGIRTYPVPEISRIPLAGFGLIILLALLLSMGWLVAASIIKLLVCIVKK